MIDPTWPILPTLATETDAKPDMVNDPPHYQGKGMDAEAVVDAFDLGYYDGNAVTYILRAKKKWDMIEDYKKAYRSIGRLISQLESNP